MTSETSFWLRSRKRAPGTSTDFCCTDWIEGWPTDAQLISKAIARAILPLPYAKYTQEHKEHTYSGENDYPCVALPGVVYESGNESVYLGHLIKDDGTCTSEVMRRIAIARTAFNTLLKILTSGSIRTSTRLRILRCSIFSAFYYGCETWTLN